MTDSPMDLAQVWTTSVAAIPDDALTPRSRAVLSLTKPLGLMGSTALVAAPNAQTQSMIETRLRPLLNAALSQTLGRDVQIAVTVDTSIGDDPVGTADSNPGLDSDAGDTSSVTDLAAETVPGSSGRSDSTDDPGSPDNADHERIAAVPDFHKPDQGAFLPPAPNDPTPYADGYTLPPTLTPPPSLAPRDPADGHPYRDAEPFGSPAPAGQGQDSPAARPRHLAAVPSGARPLTPTRLNPRYTFENFVRGPSNRLAYAAASAVAEAPAKAYNPLFIYGGSGLGKTHLLHAIGNYAQQVFPDIKVLYVSSEEFTNDFINAIANVGRGGGDQREQFRRRYRDVDILMIDDIQFLERAEQTQEEFFHTFNTLHNANKQIVITSDRTPKELTTLEDRLRSRFAGGLTPDIQTPDLETRLAILRRKAAAEGITLSPEVMELIATQIQSNIRELEGALIRVSAFASLTDQGVDLAVAQHVLKDLIPDSQGETTNAPTIMQIVAEYFDVSMDDLCGRNRSKTLVMPRQIAMYLCRELTDLSLPRIGQYFGGKDHTTVMHAVKKVTNEMKEKRSIYNQVAELTAQIKTNGRR